MLTAPWLLDTLAAFNDEAEDGENESRGQAELGPGAGLSAMSRAAALRWEMTVLLFVDGG